MTRKDESLKQILDKDLQTVTQAENANGHKDVFFTKLLDGFLPEEIEEWYLSQDPLNETEKEKIKQFRESGDSFGIFREDIHRTSLYATAASLMVSSVAYPEIFVDRETAKDWHSILDEEFMRQCQEDETPIINADEPLSRKSIIYMGLNHIVESGKKLNPLDTRRLAMASEMLEQSSSIKQALINTFTKAGLDMDMIMELMYPEYKMQEQGFQAGVHEDYALSKVVYDLLAIEVMKQNPVVIDDSLKYILKRGWGASAHILGDAEVNRSDEKKQHHAQDTMLRMTKMLESIFVETGVLRGSQRGEWKGLLHELIWLLDGYMLVLSDDRYSGINLMPTREPEDAPRVGRPQLRRGYDYKMGVANDKDAHYIQLKSGSREGSDYHPRIIVIREENFQDANTKRLSAKLRAYQKVLESQFDPEVTEPALDKYVLTTVRSEVEFFIPIAQRRRHIEALADEAYVSFMEFMGQKIQQPTANRADRRRLERQRRRR